MSAATLERIRKEAEGLTPEEKVLLADQLYNQIAISQETEAAWRIELDRRAELSASGAMGSISLAEFREKYAERINRHRERTV